MIGTPVIALPAGSDGRLQDRTAEGSTPLVGGCRSAIKVAARHRAAQDPHRPSLPLWASRTSEIQIWNNILVVAKGQKFSRYSISR
jgi:hypothetical protein